MIITKSALINLQTRIYNQNLQLGWHNNYREDVVFCNLFISELSEALEGDRKGLMDDHLPEYPMAVVELGDFIIRVLDYLGLIEYHKYHDMMVSSSGHDFQEDLLYCTELTCQYMRTLNPYKLEIAINVAMCMIHDFGYDPVEIIDAKVTYNKTRADHKIENRMKDGGKKY